MGTFGSLRKKYDGFAVPACEISAGGSVLSKSGLAAVDISVDLSVGEACGSCRFSVGNIYDIGARRILPEALDKLKPGNKTEVSLGYGSRLTKVFSGYIGETRLRMDSGGTALVVYGLDARALMRQNTRRVIYKDKNMDGAVKSVLELYAPLVGSKSVNAAALGEESGIAQDDSDLSFLLAAAEERGLLLYMENDKFVMDKPSDTVCVEFDPEDAEIELGMQYLDMKITAAGCDPARHQRFVAAKPAKQKADQAKLITTERYVPLGPYLAGDPAAAVAEALAGAAVRESLYGRITCRGIPEAALGKKIKLNKLPLSPAGTGDTFTVVSVTHSLDWENGFMTIIGVTG